MTPRNLASEELNELEALLLEPRIGEPRIVKRKHVQQCGLELPSRLGVFLVQYRGFLPPTHGNLPDRHILLVAQFQDSHAFTSGLISRLGPFSLKLPGLTEDCLGPCSVKDS